MRRNHVAALLALWGFALPASSSFAQVFPGLRGVPDISRPGHIGDDDVVMCNAAPGGSRIRPNCEEATRPSSLRGEPEKLPSAPLLVPQCQATTMTGYRQQGTMARLDGSIGLKSCPAGSTGSYSVVLQVKNEKGELTWLEFGERWERSERQDVKFAADYPIGEKVELVDVRLRDLQCTCAEGAADPTADPGVDPSLVPPPHPPAGPPADPPADP